MKKTFIYTFKRTIPIIIAFLPIGLAYGILMENAGYNFLWSGATSLLVVAGSLQILMVDFFAGGFSLVEIIVITLLLNSRFIFYGLSFIDRFRAYGKWRFPLIYTLVDETYSLHCSYKPTPGVDEKWAAVFSALLVWGYWVAFSMLGGIVGSMLPFDTTGIDFAITALFVVILLEQMKEATSKLPVGVALACGFVCLWLFGASSFILPSLLLIAACLLLLRNKLEDANTEEQSL